MSADQIYCKNCGKKIDEDSNFCSFCGSKQSVFKSHIESIIPVSSSERIDSSDKGKNEKVFQNNIEPSHKSNTVRLPRKENEAMFFGIVLLIFHSIMLILIKNGTIDAYDYGGQPNGTLLIINMITRIIVATWISGISKRLKRDRVSWTIFGFLLPPLALIIIGNLTYSKSTIRKLSQ